ncbi:DEAD/DEAH box helicase family protein [Pseudomonas sp.]|uniref:DEAD/DEAH box helicase family protein n=1 Tax=Pseudomonas sp. TaxID=306 RepID=UPI003BB64624
MAAAKEAQARIKINKLLEAADWRFFDEGKDKANIALELNVKLDRTKIDDLGENFESTKNGFIDFLLLDDKGFPLVVLEAKSEEKNPLVGKEQARKYAKSLNCRFVILSNGNLHYFWDLQQGNPHIITAYPTPDSLKSYQRFEPDQRRLIVERVERDYIVQTQMPRYEKEAGWLSAGERPTFIAKNKLRFLRDYQKKALSAIQDAVADDQTRFLFEMATGTGKTLTSAAVIKMFLRTGNARRVLFLVDRLELEEQAAKAFKDYLKNDYSTVIYKERKDDWRKAEIVVTTVQSLLFNNKYKRLFSPTDFDLVISDEAHRSIGGNARAVFEYFVGYKLGLTATPRDYLKSFDASKPSTRDPREQERRMLLDTYRTFGCETGQPTFRYSLLDGVKDGFLINPVVVDARTDITTRLLSEQGYAIMAPASEEGEQEQSFISKDFEKKFFSEATNLVFCETFINNGLRDPVTSEFGKGLVFAVSQNHAAKLTQLLNEIADKLWPGKYQSDFAVQVTSSVNEAQQYTINFTNNKLLGSANFSELYKTSKARICVTVGMMTTGYDCPDILNLALMRPVYSPSDFVQIKGRGTRKHDFLEQLFDFDLKPLIAEPDKKRFKFFDFFANCEYFEEKFDYDEVLKLPVRTGEGGGGGASLPPSGLYEHLGTDTLHQVAEQLIGYEGMKIDRMFFEKFEDQVKSDATLQQQVENGQWEQAIEYVVTQLFDKPNEYFSIDKLRRAAAVDRRISLKEILQKIFGLIPYFKSKDELLEDEFQEFLLANQSRLSEDQGSAVLAMKYYFKAYTTDAALRAIIDDKRFTELNVNPAFGIGDLKAVPLEWRDGIPEYVKDYVPLNQFM